MWPVNCKKKTAHFTDRVILEDSQPMLRLRARPLIVPSHRGSWKASSTVASGNSVEMVMAEGTAVLRRNRPGTKAKVFYD